MSGKVCCGLMDPHFELLFGKGQRGKGPSKFLPAQSSKASICDGMDMCEHMSAVQPISVAHYEYDNGDQTVEQLKLYINQAWKRILLSSRISVLRRNGYVTRW